MKILHIAVSGEYTEGWSYQDNLLPKYHRRMGYEVTVIVGPLEFDSNGVSFINTHNDEYNLKDGRKIKRLIYSAALPNAIRNKLKPIKNLYKSIEEEAPDIIFLHGIQSVSISKILKYIKKNPNVKLFVDSHVDFSNSATNWFSKNILHKKIWHYYAQKLNFKAIKFWGVLPARVDFLIDIYKIPIKKTGLLEMGGDDELIEKLSNERNDNFSEFRILTGGKIDSKKKQVLTLIEVCIELKIPLTIFGSVSKDLIDEFNEKKQSRFIQYVGWKNQEDIYKLIYQHQLVVFPGRHSVLWEETVSIGKPLLVKRWSGTEHVNINGNCLFLDDDSKNEMKKKILLIQEEETYKKILESSKQASSKFKYSNIAKKSILETQH
ncbi:glycosyltransferase [Enterococcus italicus]|uniref:glycosyltransferase n=1 Tax=Enterococcus italicus TaxID=246144 RepID=UPI003F47ECBC